MGGRPMRARSLSASILALLTVVLASSRARAGTELGVDFDGALPVDSHGTLDGGGGFGVRLGHQIHLPAVRLTPELDYGYMHLFGADGWPDVTTHRIQGGLRLGIGEILVPFAFVHAGYGWRVSSLPVTGGGGLAVDAGVGLDVSLGPLSVGGHVGYASIAVDPNDPKWVILGLDGAIVF